MKTKQTVLSGNITSMRECIANRRGGEKENRNQDAAASCFVGVDARNHRSLSSHFHVMLFPRHFITFLDQSQTYITSTYLLTKITTIK